MRSIVVLLMCAISFSAISQAEYKVTKGVKCDKQWKINFSEESDNLELLRLKDGEVAPKPFSKSDALKQSLDAQRKRNNYKLKSSYLTSKEDVEPELSSNFNGKPIGRAGVPNDNTMAVSNDGIIISAINTFVTVLDKDGNMLLLKSLGGIVANQLGILNRFYDPKVTYDPIEDRFILMFLEGSNSSDTRIVVGFTETNDPTGNWNFYAVDGNPFGGTRWSDYPIIAHNKTDLYITVNLLTDNMSWQEGFVESYIWQINKEDGYKGETLTQNLYHDIKFNNEAVWSICPVQPAINFDQDNMYFLSVRPDAESNDTTFLHEITNHSKSGQAEYKQKVLTSDLKYGVAPSAYQPTVGFRLQTNDTRVLSATQTKDKIHYTQTSVLMDELKSGVYHGIIDGISTSNPTVTAQIIKSSTLDYAYPSIAFAGEDEDDEHSMLITFSHVGENDFPGTSAIFHNKKDGLESLYSDVIVVKEGEGLINAFVADSAERWGDYTDIQRKYNEPGVVWLCGSYGDANELNNVWIAKLKVNNDLVAIDDFISYPNPADNAINIGAVFPTDEVVTIRLVNTQGKIVKKIENDVVSAGSANFLLNTTGISSGIYILSIINEEGERLHSEKIIVE